MPYNRLIRILFAVSWIFLLLYVASLDNCDWEKNRIVSLILGLISWGATLFFAIKNAGAFDERSFHRTRPYGDRRAFWQHTRMIGWTLLLVFCAMLIRGLYYHLGWRATVVGAITLTLLLFALGAGLSAGFSLCLSGVHRKKLALSLLLYLPVLCWLLIKGRALPRWMTFQDYMIFPWDFGITNGLVFAVVFSGCAWFCAAFMRGWKTSLALAVGAIFLLPCHLRREFVIDANTPDAPLKTNSLSLKLRKNIDVADKMYQCTVTQFLRCDEPFQVGEFLTLRMLFSQKELLKHGIIVEIGKPRYSSDFPNSQFTVTNSYAESPVIRTPNSTRPRPETLILEDLFPDATIVEGGEFHWIQYSCFDPKYMDAFFALWSESEWKCTGSRNLLKRVASFRLDTGGKYLMGEDGVMTIAPDIDKDGGLTARVHTVHPIARDHIQQQYNYFISWGLRDYHFVLTNSAETKAVSMSTYGDNDNTQFGAGSSVANPVAQAHQLKDWTAEDIRDAKIHVLQTKMLERIELDQSHLILEE
jgi:hypothetical protein